MAPGHGRKKPQQGPDKASLGGPCPAMPQKRFYRARAHSNPFSDSQFPIPICPDAFDWAEYFPDFCKNEVENKNNHGSLVVSDGQGNETAGSSEGIAIETTRENQADGATASGIEQTNVDEKEEPLVRFADVGCGFGGLLVKLSPLFPDTFMVGMELRDKVSEYVRDRITALRLTHPGKYANISAIRTNTMKYLPNYFRKGQLTKMFFLFPDPHFKDKNHRRRIITTALLAEYAYVMAVGGILYTITDVEELGVWMDSHLAAHPLFQKVSQKDLDSDPVVKLLATSSEEGLKVERNGGSTYSAIYRRIGAAKAGA